MSLSFVDCSRIILAILVGRLSRYFSSRSATTPAACGEAIDVPLLSAVAVSDEIPRERMFTPGAQTSARGPKLEHDASASLMSDADVVTAFFTPTGAKMSHRSSKLLPVATA